MFNLDAILDEVRTKYYFSTNVKRPAISWSDEPWLAYYGRYDHHLNQIIVSSALNDPRVTHEMIASVVYHESLHQDFADHDRRYNAKLKLFPEYDKQGKALDAFSEQRQHEMTYKTKYNDFLRGKSKVLYVTLPYFEDYEQAFTYYDEKIYVNFNANIPETSCGSIAETLVVLLVKNKNVYHIVAWCTEGEILPKPLKIETRRFGGLDFAYQLITDYDGCWVVPQTCCMYTIDKSNMPSNFADTHLHIPNRIDANIRKDIEFMDTYSDGYLKIGLDSRMMDRVPDYENLTVPQLNKLIKYEPGFRGVWLANAICMKEDSFDAMFNRADAKRFSCLLTAAARDMEHAHSMKPSELFCVSEMIKLYMILGLEEKARALYDQYGELLDLEQDEYLRNSVQHIYPELPKLEVRSSTSGPLELVAEIEDIFENIATMENYLQSKKDPEHEFALNLIQRGVCFFRIKSEDGYKFYPSRFIGYKSNTYSIHASSQFIDGRETNRAITKVLGVKLAENGEYDKQYEEYCLAIGIQARDKGSFGVVRKFWAI